MPNSSAFIVLKLEEPLLPPMLVFRIRLFKRHGRWKSKTAKDGYVKDTVADLMSVSEGAS